MAVSVLLIAYNGEKYIARQIESIVCQLRRDDELIISDDGSVDQTISIIKNLQQKYQNIKLVYGPHRGIAANLTNAYMQAKGDIVCFSDQDDIWNPVKLSTISVAFSNNPTIDVILHDAQICDQHERMLPYTLFTSRKSSHGIFSNLLRSTYYGCCMCFRRSFLQQYMPLPDNLISYDQYFGLKAEWNKKSLFIDSPLLVHRYHGQNQSHRLSGIERIFFRMKLIWQTITN